jgi:REP-associated tyrosine transposase
MSFLEGLVSLRRYYVADAIVFITQVMRDRRPILADDGAMALLRATLRQVKTLHPFSMLGYVFLPDHLHLLIHPTGDSDFSQIMHSLKPNFTKAYKAAKGHTGGLRIW